MSGEARAAHAGWDSAGGVGLSPPRGTGRGQCSRSSNGRGEEEAKRSRGGKKKPQPSEVQFENTETALLAHQTILGCPRSARSQILCFFLPGAHGWGSAPAPAGASGGRRAAAHRALPRRSGAPRTPREHPGPAGAAAAAGRKQIRLYLMSSAAAAAVTAAALPLFSPLWKAKGGRAGSPRGARPPYSIPVFCSNWHRTKTPVGKTPPKPVEAFDTGSK